MQSIPYAVNFIIYRRYILTFLLIISAVCSHSQSNRFSASDTVRYKSLRTRFDKEIENKQYSEARTTVDSMFSIVSSIGRNRDIGDCYFDYGTIERALGNKQEMILHMKSSINFYLKANAYKAAGKSYFMIGQTYIELKDESMALDNFKQSLALREKALDSLGMANSSVNVGALVYKTGDYSQASNYYFKALTLAQKLNNDKLRAVCLSNLSHLSNKMNNYGQSIEYLNEALVLQRKLGNRQAESNVLTNFGTTYIEMKNYEKAKEMFSLALKIKEEINDEKGIAGSYANLGIIARNENDTALSRKYIIKALSIARKIGDKEVEANALASLSLLSSMSNSVDAEKLLLQSLKKAKELNNPVLIMANYKNLKEYYEKKGDHVKALEFASLYQSLDDSTFKESTSDKVLEMQTRYETAEKERQLAEVTRQKLEQELRLNKANQLKYSLIGLSVFLLILAALLYSRNIIKKRAQEKLARINNQLNELNNTKDKLFSIVSHDLKNSVSAFINITDTLNNNYDTISNEDKRYLVNEMSGSANAMKNLFRNLLDWAKSQRNLISINLVDINLPDLIGENIEQLSSQLNRKEIRVSFSQNDGLIAKTDRDILNSVLRNILTNAVKFSPNGSEIVINAGRKDDKLFISVTDHGVGMSGEELEHLRQSSHSIGSKADTEGEKGAGLGLLLSGELLQKISATLEIVSEKGNGSTFTILLPQ